MSRDSRPPARRPFPVVPEADVEDGEAGVQRREARLRHSGVPPVADGGDAEEQQECPRYLQYFRRERRHLP